MQDVKDGEPLTSQKIESLGNNIKYIGPVDGHDIRTLIEYLRYCKNYNGPVILHVKTIKGKGYKKAEDDKIGIYHGVGKFDLSEGVNLNNKTLTYSQAACLAISKYLDNDKEKILAAERDCLLELGYESNLEECLELLNHKDRFARLKLLKSLNMGVSTTEELFILPTTQLTTSFETLEAYGLIDRIKNGMNLKFLKDLFTVSF